MKIFSKKNLSFFVSILCLAIFIIEVNVHLNGVFTDYLGKTENQAYTFPPVVNGMILLNQNNEELQKKSNTCGPAVLSKVMRLYGIEVSEEVLETKLKTKLIGTSMIDLLRVIQEYSLKAKGLRMNEEQLKKFVQVNPAIIYGNNHYMLVMQYYNGLFHVFDPEIGELLIQSSILDNIWSGEVIIFYE